jgi:hypothetical protein
MVVDLGARGTNHQRWQCHPQHSKDSAKITQHIYLSPVTLSRKPATEDLTVSEAIGPEIRTFRIPVPSPSLMGWRVSAVSRSRTYGARGVEVVAGLLREYPPAGGAGGWFQSLVVPAFSGVCRAI